MSSRAAFYCVSSAEYFLGAVAMINSLRLNGHREPIYLLDAGLSDDQRALLAAEVTIVKAPEEWSRSCSRPSPRSLTPPR